MAKVQIIASPEKMKLGGQPGGYAGQAPSPNFSLNTGARVFDYTDSLPNPFVASETLQPVERDEATLEAEKGETLVRKMPDGTLGHFDIGGKPHSEGGTPLKGEPGDFIFSQTRSMALGGSILENFGKPKDTTKKYTPAELAKQYEINKYKAIVDNPDSDRLQKDTAQRMIDNSMRKLQELAMVQEAKKGFPDGLPQVAGVGPNGVIQAKYGGLMKAQMGMNNTLQIPGVTTDWFGRTEQQNDPQGNLEDMFAYLQGNPDRTDQLPNPEGNLAEMASYFQENPGPTSDHGQENWNEFGQQIRNVNRPHSTWQPHPDNNFEISNPVARTYGKTGAERLTQGTALYALATTPKYEPYAAPIPVPVTAQPFLASPERELAALQESAQTQSMINALSQRGSRQRSVGSSIQGQLIPAIGNAIARNQAQNLPEINRANAMNADIANRYASERAQRLTGLNAAANEMDLKYKDAMNQRFSNLAKTQQELERNEMYRNITNQLNPNYYYDPKTKTIKFKAGNHNPLSGAGASAGPEDIGAQVAHFTAQIKKSNPSIDNETATKMAFDYIKAQRSRESSDAFNPRKSTSVQSGTRGFTYGEDAE